MGFVISMSGVGIVMSVSPRHAGAHEVKVAIAVPRPASDPAGDTRSGLDGMRLGIDQSPDVGHAPGSDAGDHLGGVDVDLVVLETLRLRANDVPTEDAEIVVVLDPDAVAETARVLAGRSILLIAVLLDDAPAPAVRPDLMIVLRPEPPEDTTPAAAAFEAEFTAAYLRAPTEADAIGYDVAQVLDVLLATTDGGEPDTTAISTVESEVAPRLTATRFDPQTATGAAASDRDAATSPRGRLLFLALVASGIVALVGAALGLRRRVRTS